MTASTPVLLELRQVTKQFGGILAVDRVDLQVRQGEVLGLIGPNGAGKTTVFNLISGVMAPSSGEIRFRGQSIGGWRPDQVTWAGIARTFQAASFLPRHDGARERGDRRALSPSGRASRQTRGHGHRVRTGAHGAARLPGSAGRGPQRFQQKRLEIARAIATEPELLMTDEVVAGLTPAETDEILAILMGLNRDGMSLVFVEHDVRAVLSVSQRLVVLAQGALLAEGDPQAVARSPDVIRVYLGNRYAAGR